MSSSMSNVRKVIHRLQLLLFIVAIAGIGTLVYRQAKIRLMKKELDQPVMILGADSSATFTESQQVNQQKIESPDTNTQAVDSLREQKIAQQLNNYRTFLRTVNVLITDFFLDKKHDDLMQIIELPSIPLQVQQIIKSLQQYNPTNSVEVFPKNSGWISMLISKSISIDKCSVEQNEQRAELMKSLTILQDYLYSDVLLHQFLN